MFSNCFSFIFEIEPFTLNPANNIDAAPATPKIVINILFLYLNIFRAVTFCVNFILFQIGVILSNSIFEPAFGALGCNKLAVVSCKSPFATAYAGSTLLISDNITAKIVIPI